MRVLLVDDHLLFNDGVTAIIHGASPSNSVDVALDGKLALEKLSHSGHEYDLILIDLTMPEMDGLELLRRLREQRQTTPAIVLSATEDVRSIAVALRLGSFGFIPKSHSKSELLFAIQTVLAGDLYLPDQTRRNLDKLDLGTIDGENPVERGELTPRQMEVLNLLGTGMSNKQIASTLFLSLHTVKFHIASLLSIFGAHNRTDCVARAIARGLISDQ